MAMEEPMTTKEYSRARDRLGFEGRVRPARPDEYDAVIALVERRFGTEDAASSALTTTLRRDPRFRPEHLRVVEAGGAVVGMMLFIDRVVRVGTAKVRCGIVAPVATDEAYEGRGVCSMVMRDALDWAKADGYHLSMLWGHTWLYPRYGYAPGLKRYCMTLHASLPPVGDVGFALRAATAADAPALAKCYHVATATTTFAEIRSDEPWEWRPANDEQIVEVVLDPLGEVRGYFRATVQDESIDVQEIAALDDHAAQSLYDRLLRLARDTNGNEVRVQATPDMRWSRWAFAHGASATVSNGSGHGMVRVLDMPAFFRAILPELERRVRLSEFRHEAAHMRLETPLGSLGFLVDHGTVRLTVGREGSLVTLPWSAFGSLVAGYRAAETLRGQPGVRIEGEHTLRLLQVLFPEGNPHWSAPAYFWS
jgi:predicted N-acetyltransferase YhbS